ncbi:MAG: DinB family protein, partial [Vicinamibacterales bacterium]
MTFTSDVQTLLIRELDGLGREVGLFPDDHKLWVTPVGVANSAGNLALHVAGNLQHFVGALLGGSGYVRDRNSEFATRTGTRAQVQHELQAAVQAVESTLARMDTAALQRPMPGAPNGLTIRTDLFLLHLVSHAAFHLGQAGYVRRIVCGDGTSS